MASLYTDTSGGRSCCKTCNGRGEVRVTHWAGGRPWSSSVEKCSECKGADTHPQNEMIRRGVL